MMNYVCRPMLQRVSYSFLHRESWAWPSVTSFRWDHVWNKPTFLHKQVYINSCRRTVYNIFALSLPTHTSYLAQYQRKLRKLKIQINISAFTFPTTHWALNKRQDFTVCERTNWRNENDSIDELGVMKNPFRSSRPLSSSLWRSVFQILQWRCAKMKQP